MAKQSRGGLGRGLGSLLGNQYENNNERINLVVDRDDEEVNTTSETTVSQENNRIVFDARNDEVLEVIPTKASNIPPDITGEFDSVGVDSVSRETSEDVEKNNNPRDLTDKNLSYQQIMTENIIYEVDIDCVVPNPEQPRTNFNEDELKELSNSIKREGIIQPILVRQGEDNTYQIIAGERRWQASKLIGKETVPIQIKEVTDEKALELALIENIQRSDLNPIEEAYGYKRLMERNQMTQADIAQAVSKGRSTIANALRLLELPEDAQKLLFDNKITAGHARAILSVPDKEGRAKLTRKLEDGKLTVRETENLARLMSNKTNPKAPKEPIPASYKSVARELKNNLDTNVKVKSSKGKNRIEIEFKDERDLERIFDLINPE